jgi:ribosomal protein S18 acetylase RimI-like enzyme
MQIADRDSLRPFLEADPVGSAVVWDRVFQQPRFQDVLADGLPPHAVLALARSDRAAVPMRIAIDARDGGSARAVLRDVPPGPVNFHAAEESLVEALRERSETIEARPAWLYALDPSAFVDLQAHPVQPVAPGAAAFIAERWEPDWPSERYVRSRIEGGPTAGIYVDGALVAWAMTHFVTPRVAMLGFFHVLKERRRLGYGKSAASALTKEVLRRGLTPVLHVNVDNAPSIDLVEKLGYRRVKRQVWGDAVLR